MIRVTPLLFLMLVAVSSSARSDDSKRNPRSDALMIVTDTDPMQFARAVDRMGDGAVMARLGRDNPIEIRLAAIRASRWMRAPEKALATLAQLVSSRDSELAPAAARAAWRIASGLSPDVLAEREVVTEDLSPVVVLFERAADNALLREDIRLLSAQTADALKAAGVP